MDNIAHTLAGAALGEAGLKRRSGLGMATLVIGANLPDVDALTIFTGGAIAFRRGWTHGVLAMAVLPLLLVGLMLAWDRWVRREPARHRAPVRPLQLLLLAFLAVLSHPLLDWLNNYGVRLLMPFDGTWFYGDALFIIDPWMWASLAVGVAASRRVARKLPARLALALVALYAVIMAGTAAYGRAAVRQAMAAEGLRGEMSVMVGPVPVNPFTREVVVAESGFYRTGTMRWLPAPRLELGGPAIPRNDAHPAARAAAETPAGRAFLVWSRFPYFVVEEGSGGTRVRMDDARYARGGGRSFAGVEVVLPTAAPD